VKDSLVVVLAVTALSMPVWLAFLIPFAHLMRVGGF